jgi:hypothetical protein
MFLRLCLLENEDNLATMTGCWLSQSKQNIYEDDKLLTAISILLPKYARAKIL